MLTKAPTKTHNLIDARKALQQNATASWISPLEKCCSNFYFKGHIPVLAKQADKQHFFTNKYDYNCCQIIRPLMLDSSRALITAICKYANMPVYPDKSNLSIQYSRNRIRKQILPVLTLFFNPQTENALFQFAQFVFTEQKMLERLLYTAVY